MSTCQKYRSREEAETSETCSSKLSELHGVAGPPTTEAVLRTRIVAASMRADLKALMDVQR